MTDSWEVECQGWFFIMKNIKGEWKKVFLWTKREKHVKVKQDSQYKQSENVRTHTAYSIHMDVNTGQAKKSD